MKLATYPRGFRQALQELESGWSGSAEALFEAKINLLEPYLLKKDDRCPFCRTQLVFNYEHDSDFCPNCNHWFKERCGGSTCYFCSTRPATPYPSSPQHRARMAKLVRARKLSSIRLPKKLLDEIVARCERAVRSRSPGRGIEMINPMLGDGFKMACPKQVQKKIDNALSIIIFGTVGRSARSQQDRRAMAGGTVSGPRAAKKLHPKTTK